MWSCEADPASLHAHPHPQPSSSSSSSITAPPSAPSHRWSTVRHLAVYSRFRPLHGAADKPVDARFFSASPLHALSCIDKIDRRVKAGAVIWRLGGLMVVVVVVWSGCIVNPEHADGRSHWRNLTAWRHLHWQWLCVALQASCLQRTKSDVSNMIHLTAGRCLYEGPIRSYLPPVCMHTGCISVTSCTSWLEILRSWVLLPPSTTSGDYSHQRRQ